MSRRALGLISSLLELPYLVTRDIKSSSRYVLSHTLRSTRFLTMTISP